MAPKRKRAAEPAGDIPTRVTRASSSRAKGAVGDTQDVARMDTDMAESEPLPKKTKRAPARNAASKGNATHPKAQQSTNEPRAESSGQDSNAAPSNGKPVLEPYSSVNIQTLFGTYADADDPSVIGPEGFERLCTDMDVSLEGALPLLLAWQLNAGEMAKISKSEWETGLRELQISCLAALALALHELEDLVLIRKPALKPSVTPAPTKKKSSAQAPAEPYNRARYHQYAGDVDKAFSELYSYCFALAKPPQARNIDIETATAFWAVLLVPRHPIMSDVLDFISEMGTYKGVTKDLWSMMLEFCRSVKPDLSDYEADGAWPTMLDDFAAWKIAKTTASDVEMAT